MKPLQGQHSSNSLVTPTALWKARDCPPSHVKQGTKGRELLNGGIKGLLTLWHRMQGRGFVRTVLCCQNRMNQRGNRLAVGPSRLATPAQTNGTQGPRTASEQAATEADTSKPTKPRAVPPNGRVGAGEQRLPWSPEREARSCPGLTRPAGFHSLQDCKAPTKAGQQRQARKTALPPAFFSKVRAPHSRTQSPRRTTLHL